MQVVVRLWFTKYVLFFLFTKLKYVSFLLPRQEFDVYGNGLIGVEDLLYVFRKLGDDEITKEEVEMMIIDATGTAKRKEVTLEEFKAVSKGF